MNSFMILFNPKYDVILVNDYYRAHKEHKLILGLDLKKINGKKNFWLLIITIKFEFKKKINIFV